MESVPETESLQEFRSPPAPGPRSSSLHVPTLRLQSTDFDLNRGKPSTVRRSTEPPPPCSPNWAPPSALSLPYRPRTTSPLSGHVRSKSAASLAPPTMSRTRSMPGVDGAGRILASPLLRPASPSGSPSRNRAPRRKPMDEVFPPPSPVRMSVLDSERFPNESSAGQTFDQRTSSPFRHAVPPASSSTSSLPSTPSSVATSYSYRDTSSSGYNFPVYYPSSSVPSTPSSIRSRSPSISSLETIPDSPDAEEAALEDERMAKLRAAAEGSDGEESGESRGRFNLDVPSRGRTLGLGSRDKRKRWSVCGAERRGDLDLETIWED